MAAEQTEREMQFHIRVSPKEKEMLDEIIRFYSLESMSSAIRTAVRQLHSAIERGDGTNRISKPVAKKVRPKKKLRT